MNNLLNFIGSGNRNLLFILILTTAIHIPFLNLPPCSIHVWRQCNTLAVARNFSEESMNIFKPRVDRRGNTDGITGMQFPAYEYGVAVLYKLFGEHYFISRLFSLVLYLLSIVCFYFFIFRISKSAIAAFAGAWSLCWSAELFYHGINALPDILALCSGIFSIYFSVKWREEKKHAQLIFTFFFLAMAGLVKIQYLMFGGFIGAAIFQSVFKKEINLKNLLLPILLGTITLMVCISWYVYAIGLIEKSGLRDFGLEFRPATDWAEAKKIILRNLISDLPELLLNYAGTVLFISGVIVFFFKKGWKNIFFIPLLSWFILFVAYYFTELKQMDVHQYYLLPLLPSLCVAMSYGSLFLFKSNRSFLFLVILAAQPIFASIRILPARWLNQNRAVPPELFESKTNAMLRNSIPDNALCIAGPDDTGCKYLFFLHKKGFDFSYPEQLASKTADGKMYLEDCITKGAHYLITPDNSVLTNSELKNFYQKEILSAGNFKVIELKAQ